MTTEIKPFTLLAESSVDEMNKTRLEHKGVEIELFKLILEHLNLPYEYKVFDPDIPVTCAVLAALTTGDFDIMFRSTPLHELVSNYGEPSISHYKTGYKWYVPCPAPIPRLVILSPTVWVTFIISFAAVVAAMWLLVKCRDVTENKDYRTDSSCANCVCSTAMGVSASQPSTTTLRTLFFLWVSYCYNTWCVQVLRSPNFFSREWKQIET
jgi:hypothetical protein